MPSVYTAMTELGNFPEQVETPVGSIRAQCDAPIEEGDRGRIIEWGSAADRSLGLAGFASARNRPRVRRG